MFFLLKMSLKKSSIKLNIKSKWDSHFIAIGFFQHFGVIIIYGILFESWFAHNQWFYTVFNKHIQASWFWNFLHHEPKALSHIQIMIRW